MQVPDMHWRLLEQSGLQGDGILQDEPLDISSGQISVVNILVPYY